MAAQGSQCADCWRELIFLTPPLCDRCGVPFAHEGQGERQAERQGEGGQGEGGQGEGGGAALLCPDCLAHPPAFRRARALYWYSEAAKRLILPLKHAGRTELAPWLADRMASAEAALIAGCDLILPVPLHRGRLFARGYNQAAMLARQLARRSGRPWSPALLRRRRATPPLGGRGRAERAALLRDAFALAPAAPARLAGRHLLLVDDVLTSGATADACARLLLDAGAASITVLAVARVVDGRLVEKAASASA